jgi:hypothetical protein
MGSQKGLPPVLHRRQALHRAEKPFHHAAANFSALEMFGKTYGIKQKASVPGFFCSDLPFHRITFPG